MRTKNMIFNLLLFGVITIGVAACNARQRAAAPPAATDSQAVRGGQANLTLLATGTSPDLSRDGTLIAFNREVNDCYEVFLMNADGSNQRQLTGDTSPAAIQGKHKGKAAFHPGGQYLLIGCENEHGDHGLTNLPGIGDDYDLWVTDLTNGTYTRLTNLPAGSSIQYPRFSSDGTRLVWSQRYEKKRGAIFRRGQEYGYWKIMIADFVVGPAGPRLENQQALEPGGRGYYEPHGYSPDGAKLIMSAAIDPVATQLNLDIYTYDLSAKTMTNLTSSPGIHDEMALYSPDGTKIALMSGTFVGWFPEFGYKTDLYVMDADGGNRVQLTHFNDPALPGYPGNNSQITKLSWRPDGRRLVFGLYVHKVNQYFIYALDL